MNLYSYLGIRNKQIAEFKKQGFTWRQIANKVGLSRGYVKTITRKQGVYSDDWKKDLPNDLPDWLKKEFGMV